MSQLEKWYGLHMFVLGIYVGNTFGILAVTGVFMLSDKAKDKWRNIITEWRKS